jgi:sugar/nucleoside kinase (ribokinase family)
VPDMPSSRGVEGGGGDWEQNALPVTGENTLPGQRTGGRPFYTACGWACLYHSVTYIIIMARTLD